MRDFLIIFALLSLFSDNFGVIGKPSSFLPRGSSSSSHGAHEDDKDDVMYLRKIAPTYARELKGESMKGKSKMGKSLKGKSKMETIRLSESKMKGKSKMSKSKMSKSKMPKSKMGKSKMSKSKMGKSKMGKSKKGKKKMKKRNVMTVSPTTSFTLMPTDTTGPMPIQTQSPMPTQTTESILPTIRTSPMPTNADADGTPPSTTAGAKIPPVASSTFAGSSSLITPTTTIAVVAMEKALTRQVIVAMTESITFYATADDRAPTVNEVEALLVATEDFYANYLKSIDEVNEEMSSNILGVKIRRTSVSYEYTVGAERSLDIRFDTEVTLVGTSTISGGEVSIAMTRADLHSFIVNYIWVNKTNEQNQLNHIHGVDQTKQAIMVGSVA